MAGSDVVVGTITDLSIREGKVGLRTYTGASHVSRVLVASQSTAGFVAEDAGASDQMWSHLTAKEGDGIGYWIKQGDMEISNCRAYEYPVGFQIERAATLVSPKTWGIPEYGINLKDNDRLIVLGGNLACNNGIANVRLRVTSGGSSINETTISGTRFQHENGVTRHIEVAVADSKCIVEATISGATFESGADAIEVTDATGDVDILFDGCYIGQQSTIPDGVKFRNCHGPGAPVVQNDAGNNPETQSGDGTNRYYWSHGLDRKPTSVNVEPASDDAKGDYHVEVGTSTITVDYASAPPEGTDNLKWWWNAEDNR
ncbi:hypothetical protein PM025_15330 [Halorubrum ezzemoulense]|uniref:hypothetical protein n=1 Tax=Halorubrum ezzemoulense TaxID=337243 RepID=UPI00232B30DD|nr:hypothetical protein [Halorubrum ezzemoulense]MDB2265483.1 hypothetical protein [Halorubrum ezzemoulense]MDB9302595.1 hypothetical protein [Halorubrum ezzemoulense]